VRIDLPIDAHLSPDYIASDRLRLEGYRRLAAAADDAAVDSVIEELVDRYGPLPESARRLVAVARLRLLFRHYGITEISAISESTAAAVAVAACPTPSNYGSSGCIRARNYRATTSTVQVPIPRAGSGVGAPRIRDLELVAMVAGWCWPSMENQRKVLI